MYEYGCTRKDCCADRADLLTFEYLNFIYVTNACRKISTDVEICSNCLVLFMHSFVLVCVCSHAQDCMETPQHVPFELPSSMDIFVNVNSSNIYYSHRCGWYKRSGLK